MGADSFYCDAPALTDDLAGADKAFRSCVEQAQYDHGHSGYTGTIAEKPGFEVFKLNPDYTADQLCSAIESDPTGTAKMVTSRNASRIVDLYDDKWGNAVAVYEAATDRWCFMGLASC